MSQWALRAIRGRGRHRGLGGKASGCRRQGRQRLGGATGPPSSTSWVPWGTRQDHQVGERLAVLLWEPDVCREMAQEFKGLPHRLNQPFAATTE